ncbi:MAG: glycosyltransferase family 2 protein [Anaerolineae bacterium]|nr:glycosyltransferase family 2 protein [Anaerolineae bacterium]
MASQTVCAVVVTYNRQELLKQCLQALLTQTRPPDEILVVNNASTDGTPSMLKAEFPHVRVLNLEENVGGAGGFYAGMEWAYQQGFQWVLVLDDDLMAAPQALQYLLDFASLKQKVFAAGVVTGNSSDKLVWPLKIEGRWHFDISALPDIPFPVETVSFLGMFVPATAIQEAGLPRKDFFVNADDLEYCYRVTKAGYNLFCVPKSRLSHPLPERHILRAFGKMMFFENIPPWKAYYDIRNRYILGKQYFGLRFWAKILPMLLLKSLLLTWTSKNKPQTLTYCLKGFRHAIFEQTGARVKP